MNEQVDAAQPLPPRLVFERVPVRSGSFDHAFDVGIHTVLGTRDSGALELFELASGGVSPRRGRVLLGGRQLAREPRLRRRVAATSPGPLPDFPTVEALVEACAMLRGHSVEPVWSLLKGWGTELSRVARPRALPEAMAQRIQLALAMAHEAADVLLLWDPFGSGATPSGIVEMIRARGLCQVVLVFVPTLPEPPLPGVVLHFGASAPASASRARTVGCAGSLWIAAEPIDRLAQRLVAQPNVVGVEILHGQPGLLRVGIAGQAATEVGAAVLAIAHEQRIRIRGIRFEPEAAA